MASTARWSVRPRPWPRARSSSPRGVQQPRWSSSTVHWAAGELQLPYEEATARLLIGTTQRLLGDEEGGRIEVDAARAGFDRLGAAADAQHAAALLQQRRASPRVL